ncbi:sulfite exporter TauE/SafE family protein [Alteromonas aestuariivivens]|uniref:Sulfite exporter TauE/SafE family protein n=1 Tax=Alteromonas aestuariivivens TaxID=1938339 RepID=A0A3D8M341_9ALTE|nr:sulfite exporter TauE/SafE family protein [Alteromonas aestuariivivens]RDV24133.1 sulfite exporter TauE/SafE family protein [Alteromonas aestuariivivens]
MTDFNALSALLVGLAGGVHCVGMCGGIVGAFKLASPPGQPQWPYAAGYNIGRIASYTLAGGITGALGQITTSGLPNASALLQLLSALMLIALSAYLGQWWQGLQKLEQFGHRLWRYIQPVSKRFLPFRSPLQAIPYGMIWGWLPCGLVYSTLTWSLASGSAAQGATLMLFFGLGTLPTLLAANWGFKWLVAGLQSPRTRRGISGVLLAYAVFLMYRAALTF